MDLKQWERPKDVDNVMLAFPTSVEKFMPTYDDIREIEVDDKWYRLFADCFYGGLESLELIPQDGIDPGKAWRHIRYVMGSREPKHQHKEAGVAFLMSRFFKDAKWTSKKRRLP